MRGVSGVRGIFEDGRNNSIFVCRWRRSSREGKNQPHSRGRGSTGELSLPRVGGEGLPHMEGLASDRGQLILGDEREVRVSTGAGARGPAEVIF